MPHDKAVQKRKCAYKQRLSAFSQQATPFSWFPELQDIQLYARKHGLTGVFVKSRGFQWSRNAPLNGGGAAKRLRVGFKGRYSPWSSWNNRWV